MVEQLFGSKTRVKLLKLFLKSPNRAFFVREITRKIDEQINSVRRELANLLDAGIITSTSESNNNKLFYEINQQNENYESLRELFGFSRGKKYLASPVANRDTPKRLAQATDSYVYQLVREAGPIDYLALTGAFTRDRTAEIDILVVGDLKKGALRRVMHEIEERENRPIRYTSMDLEEFDYRKEVNDRFISNVLDSKLSVIFESDRLEID